MIPAFYPIPTRWLKLPLAILALSSVLFLTGCSDDDDDDDSDSEMTEQTSAPLFPANGNLQANIRRTTDGVPHIKADDLSSAAFGAGYVQAKDNVCVLADAFLKARSERAKYLGPGPGDINVIKDFSYKALDIRSGAEREFENLSDESRALIEGFAAGYNKYVSETDPADLPAECRSQPWVMEISPIDLLAHYRIVGQFASGDLFSTGAVFLAVPPGQSSNPTPVMSQVTTTGAEKVMPTRVTESARRLASQEQDYSDFGLASNAWGIGSDLSEQGRGALLANPHFPYTGHRRLYQMQMTVPGYMNMNGAGLLATAIPLINYNENLAWSHTVTTSRRFTLYELTLKQGDDLTYIKDGEEKPITRKTFQVEVNNGTPNPTTLERNFYFSEYGPMLAADVVTGEDGLEPWGGAGALGAASAAYTYRDANADTTGLLDTWLQMSRSTNLEEFQDVFRNECGSTLWTNTTYADDQGNAFYIDSSSVPNLSAATLANIDFLRRFSSEYSTLFDNELTLLDGSTSRDDWDEGDCGGLVPYEDKPRLQRTDFVQNSNSSHWATNPAQFLTGFSPLFGAENAPINARTRLGITMLQNPLDTGFAEKAPAGDDGKFGGQDLIEVIYNNRSWYAEEFLAELRERCTMIGGDPVNLPDENTRSVEEGCGVLANWNGVYDTDSVGAHVFRVFIDHYNDQFDSDLTVAFDRRDPVGTPTGPSTDGKGTANDVMLQSLAMGLEALDSVNIDYSAALGDVQYYQPTGGALPGLPGGSIEGGTAMVLSPPIPWHGGDGGVDGTFNAIGVVSDDYAVDTVIPRLGVDKIDNTGGLSSVVGIDNQRAGWPMARGTSWHFGLEFTDNGPEAFGLVSYSQSTDSMSDFFTDQSERYSEKNYREFAFTEAEIEANLLDQGEVTISSD